MKYLILIFALTGCQLEPIYAPVQFDPIVCSGGWQYDLNGNEIVDDTGAMRSCIPNG